MPLEVYREKLEEHSANVQQSATGLLNIIGAGKNLTSGYAGWMAKVGQENSRHKPNCVP
jgi:hypothetical protein